MDTVRTPNADQERMQAGKRLVIDAWTVELLPRRPYEVTYTPEEAVVGFAFGECQNFRVQGGLRFTRMVERIDPRKG